MRNVTFLGLAILASACATSEPEPEIQIGDGKSDGYEDFDIVGTLAEPGDYEYTLVEGKRSVFVIRSDGDDVIDLRVTSDEAELRFEVLPLQPDNLFGKQAAESYLGGNRGARVRGLGLPIAGPYVVIVSDEQRRAAPIQFTWATAKAEGSRWTIPAEIRGPRRDGDKPAAHAAWQTSCAAWQDMMAELSGDKAELLDCGKATEFDKFYTSHPRVVVGVPGATFDELSPSPAGAAIEGSSGEDWLAKCETQLRAAKDAAGGKYVAGTCGSVTSVVLGVRGVVVETITSKPTAFVAPTTVE